MTATTSNELSYLGLGEIIDHVQDVMLANDIPKPVLIYIEGKQADEIQKALKIDYVEDFERCCSIVESKTDAFLIIKQSSDPFRNCSHSAGDFKDVSIYWKVDVTVSLSSQFVELLNDSYQGFSWEPSNNECFIYYDREVDGVDLFEYLSEELATSMKKQGKTNASIPEIELETNRRGWERIITDDERTPRFSQKMRSAVCSMTKRKLRTKIDRTRTIQEYSKGWLGLRERVHSLYAGNGLSVRDCIIISRFLVPELSFQKKTDLRRSLIELDDFPDPDVRQPALNAVIRRNQITNTDLGRIGEAFTHRLLAPLVECCIGPRPSGVCDLSDRNDGDPRKAVWAVNVKISLEDEVNRSFEVAPEHQVSRSWVLLIMPRALTMRLYRITGDNMTINSRVGGLCVTPEDLAETVKGLIEGDIEI